MIANIYRMQHYRVALNHGYIAFNPFNIRTPNPHKAVLRKPWIKNTLPLATRRNSTEAAFQMQPSMLLCGILPVMVWSLYTDDGIIFIEKDQIRRVCSAFFHKDYVPGITISVFIRCRFASFSHITVM